MCTFWFWNIPKYPFHSSLSVGFLYCTHTTWVVLYVVSICFTLSSSHHPRYIFVYYILKRDPHFGCVNIVLAPKKSLPSCMHFYLSYLLICATKTCAKYLSTLYMIPACFGLSFLLLLLKTYVHDDRPFTSHFTEIGVKKIFIFAAIYIYISLLICGH